MKSETVQSTARFHRIHFDLACSHLSNIGFTAFFTAGLAILFTVLAATVAPTAGAQEQSSDSAQRPTAIRVEVRIDPTKTGQERCVVEPEDLMIPAGLTNVTWALMAEDSGALSALAEARLDTVGFEPSLPVTESERIDAVRWEAVFDCDDPFPQIPYDLHIQEADGNVIECYPHVASSADQGG